MTIDNTFFAEAVEYMEKYDYSIYSYNPNKTYFIFTANIDSKNNPTVIIFIDEFGDKKITIEDSTAYGLNLKLVTATPLSFPYPNLDLFLNYFNYYGAMAARYQYK